MILEWPWPLAGKTGQMTSSQSQESDCRFIEVNRLSRVEIARIQPQRAAYRRCFKI
jgi:hypothetical protein